VDRPQTDRPQDRIEGHELRLLVDYLEQAGYLETDYEENVQLTAAGRRAVTKSRTGMRAGKVDCRRSVH
jgi:hypothetical protein